jgi:hypothetical protein
MLEIPQKPQTKAHFKGPVQWLLGRQLIGALKWIALYAIFQDKLDARDWMKAEPIAIPNDQVKDGEFWFDYIADTGDSQLATYSVAYLCLSDLYVDVPLQQELPRVGNEVSFSGDEDRRLPRGALLIVGGDTSYHIADLPTLTERFQWPFCWAFEDLKIQKKITDERRPLFGIPGNHDHYDALDGFNRQFRKPLTDEGKPRKAVRDQRPPPLDIPCFKRCQESSYVALKLPFDWWFWGLDLEEDKIDARQEDFFLKLKKCTRPHKLIVATPAPTTVFGKYQRNDEALAQTFELLKLERPFLKGAPPLSDEKCRLDLSGDYHHYARYWGPRSHEAAAETPSAPNYASVMAGLGGAYLHPSHTNMQEVIPQAIYPAPDTSHQEVPDLLLKPRRILRGGFLSLAGLGVAILTYAAATFPPQNHKLLDAILICNSWPAPEFSSLCHSLNSLLFFIPSFLALAWLVCFYKEAFDRTMQGDYRPLVILILAVFVSPLVGLWIFGCQWVSYFKPFLLSLGILSGLLLSLVVLCFNVLASKERFDRATGKRTRANAYREHWLVRALRVVADAYRAHWLARPLRVAAGVLARILRVVGVVFPPLIAIALWGGEPAKYVVADLIFLLVMLGGTVGLMKLAVYGGQLPGKPAYWFLLGFWHAILQLTVPFLLVRTGTLFTLLCSAVLWAIFTKIGLAIARKKWPRRLLVAWLLYGLLQLSLVMILPTLVMILPKVVPPGWPTGWLTMPISLWFSNMFSSPWDVLVGAILAGLLGIFLTCIWFGWYLAVALGFNGHNNEVGAAARIEKFKGFIRFRLTASELTGFVIGVDEPHINGWCLRPKIVDVFSISCAKQEPPVGS